MRAEPVVVTLVALVGAFVVALASCGSTPSAGADRDVLLTAGRITPMPNGLQPFFHVRDIGKPGVPKLTRAMLRAVERASNAIEPAYRSHLALLFEPFRDRNYLVIFLEGFPRFPALNFCESRPGCRKECRIYVNPVTHRAMIATFPSCADNLPYWARAQTL